MKDHWLVINPNHALMTPTKSRRVIESVKLTVFLHDAQELDNDLGARSDQDLSLAGLFGVVDAVERIVEHAGANHLDDSGMMVTAVIARGDPLRFSSPKVTGNEVSVGRNPFFRQSASMISGPEECPPLGRVLQPHPWTAVDMESIRLLYLAEDMNVKSLVLVDYGSYVPRRGGVDVDGR